MVLNIRKLLEGARRALVLTMLSVLALGGCTTVPVNLEERKAYYETNDPIEPVNRAILSFNRGLDTIVLKPVASAYKNILPKILQDGIRNFLNNLRSPIILANNLLQGDIDGARDTIARFTLNSIIGFGGGALAGPIIVSVLDFNGGTDNPSAWAFAFITMGLGSLFVLIIQYKSKFKN